jgi:hypothetical protein
MIAVKKRSELFGGHLCDKQREETGKACFRPAPRPFAGRGVCGGIGAGPSGGIFAAFLATATACGIFALFQSPHYPPDDQRHRHGQQPAHERRSAVFRDKYKHGCFLSFPPRND